jgi:uncharacterized protein (TIGR03437 family)
MLGVVGASGLAFGQAPTIFTSGTVNAADYTRSFAPGAIVSIFGTNLATAAQAAPQLPLTTSMQGTTVLVFGVPAPLLYVSAGQINAQLPYGASGNTSIQVKTAAGTSNTDTIFVAARAPKIFSIDFSGQGAVVATNSSNSVFTGANPAAPAQTVSVWMNSMGATTGSPVAGQASPQNALVSDTVTATLGSVAGTVTFAGLQPGSTGLYRVDIQSPFVALTGPVTVAVTVAGVTTQANATVQYRQLGFYYALLGSKFPNGQTRNGVSGATSALALRQSDSGTWGATGFNAWTNTTPNGAQYSTASGLALTLYNNGTIVYDNNGLETGQFGSFYNNVGGGANSTKPGLSDYYSMSNYFPLIFAGYFKLTASTTITQLVGYFDPFGTQTLPLNTANPYVKYRMNIWSITAGGLPKETGNFTGDIFSSDTVAGAFSYDANYPLVQPLMISSVAGDVPKVIYHLKYTLAAPLTLPAGEYWFAHDVSVRQQPAASSTSSFPIVTTSELQQLIRGQQGRPLRQPMRFSLLGTEMLFVDGWNLPAAVIVRPDSPVETHGAAPTDNY